MQCLYVARNMAKCPLTRGVRLREVSVSGGSTVLSIFFLFGLGQYFHFHSITFELILRGTSFFPTEATLFEIGGYCIQTSR